MSGRKSCRTFETFARYLCWVFVYTSHGSFRKGIVFTGNSKFCGAFNRSEYFGLKKWGSRKSLGTKVVNVSWGGGSKVFRRRGRSRDSRNHKCVWS